MGWLSCLGHYSRAFDVLLLPGWIYGPYFVAFVLNLFLWNTLTSIKELLGQISILEVKVKEQQVMG